MPSTAVKILLVEDSPTDADLLRESLRQIDAAHFAITWAERLEDALQLLGRESFDALLLDLSLPDSTGADTFRQARRAAPHLPIVLLTGEDDERIGLEAIRHGIQDYLVKGHADGQQIARAIRYAIERKQMELELARERAFLETAIEVLPLPLAFFDQRGKIIRENHASQVLRRQLGVTEQAKADFLDPQTKTPIPEDRQPALRSLQGEIVTAEEYLLQAPADDYQMPALVSAAPICLDGETLAAVSLIEDITALKEADRAKDEFLAVLSHEMQSPLVSILGWSREALDDGSAEFMAQAMAVVQRNAVRQKRLIDDILDMSRLIHRKIQLKTMPADLWEQACQAVENIRYEAENRNITLVQTPPDTALPIDADPERLQQCIGNLLHNSLKFTPAGGTITVSCRGGEEQGILSVRDTGRGIDPAALPGLFVVFRQVDRDERAGGLGLGLAVSRGIIELHGGRISADSPGLGMGSTFTIALPLACAVSA